MQESLVRYLGWEDALEEEMGTHSSVLAWRIPGMEEPGGLQSMGSRRVGHDWATSLSLFTFMHWRRKWQPTPAFLPGESQGWGSLVGCRLWGRRVGHDWSDLAAAAHYLWDKYLKAGTPVQRINACVVFIDPAKYPFIGIRQFCEKFPPATHKKACFPTAWPTESVVKHSAFYQSAGWEIVPQWVLIGISLLVGKAENLFMWVRPTWILPSVTSLVYVSIDLLNLFFFNLDATFISQVITLCL